MDPQSIKDILRRSGFFVCDECKGERYLCYAQYPNTPLDMDPSTAGEAVQGSVEVKREKCRTCGGTGEWTEEAKS